MGILLAMIPADNGYVPSDLEAGFYSATSRTLWAVGLAWIVFACVNGNGGFVNHALSWKPLIPLSKLTYCAYLIHPVVIATFYGSRETTFHFSHYLMVNILFAHYHSSYHSCGDVIVMRIISRHFQSLGSWKLRVLTLGNMCFRYVRLLGDQYCMCVRIVRYRTSDRRLSPISNFFAILSISSETFISCFHFSSPLFISTPSHSFFLLYIHLTCTLVLACVYYLSILFRWKSLGEGRSFW